MSTTTYRGYRLVPATSGQVAIMYDNEAVDFADTHDEAKQIIQGWMIAR